MNNGTNAVVCCVVVIIDVCGDSLTIYLRGIVGGFVLVSPRLLSLIILFPHEGSGRSSVVLLFVRAQ